MSSRFGCAMPECSAGLARPRGGSVCASSAFHADASDAADRVPLLFDGDADTRWLTGRPQNGDEWIRIAFDRPRDVSRIELQTASRSFGDYPRELRSRARQTTGRRSVLYRGTDAGAVRPRARAGRRRARDRVSLPSNRTRTLTIRQTGRTHRWFWSVHELALFER